MIVAMSATTSSVLPFFRLILIATIVIGLGLCSGSFHSGCIPSESQALLELKSGLQDPSNRLASWNSKADCCGWYGITCDNFTGHVIELHLGSTTLPWEDDYWERSSLGGKISESLHKLKQLRYLNLSYNNFNGTHIPKFLGSMKSLRYLDLSEAGFGGMIPHQLGNLSNLQYLNLQNYDAYVESLGWISCLSSLEFLNLSEVNLRKAFDWWDVLNKLSSLVELYLVGSVLNLQIPSPPTLNFSSLAILDLSGNSFDVMPGALGPIPAYLQNLTLIRELYLSSNGFNSSMPNWLFNFTHLQLLDLSNNVLQGEIPYEIGKLTALRMLDLSSNELKGKIPSAIGELTVLSMLDLSRNNLQGGIPTSFKTLCDLSSLSLQQLNLSQDIGEIIEILSAGCISSKLQSLDLSYSQISGNFPNLREGFRNLAILDLSHNLISGQIPTSLGEMTSFTHLLLSFNKLNGSLPTSFGGLAKLESVDISDNFLEGEVSEVHFANLTSLMFFDASNNYHLILRINVDWVPPFQLSFLFLRSLDIGPQFPTWLRYSKHLDYLDLSNSSISSTLPVWFHNFSSTLHQVNLSHNQMHGKILNLSVNVSYLPIIDLNSNYFEGPLPYMSPAPIWINLSNNLFSGSITKFLCNKLANRSDVDIRTAVLILKENNLSGEIPDCWMYWNSLVAIDLSSNNFSGSIPRSIGGLSGLEMLKLQKNSLYGEIPLALKHCERLTILDLSENELGGKIPSWIGGRLQSIRILNFRGNKFHSHIFKELCNMTHLLILDIANNNLNGTIPICINNLLGMHANEDALYSFGDNGLEYKGSSSIARKGQMLEYSNTLGLVRGFDLSNNQLSGEIPKEITELAELQSLNLSKNLLTGRIPEDIGAMKALESLDLSQNRLFGEIPQSMSSLSFLSALNLSNNYLSGKIPSSTQLQSQNSSSFSGNHLCGPPFTKSCIVDEAKQPSIGEEKDLGDGDGAIDWFYFFVSMAPGFVVGFWGVIGPLAFNRRWRRSYYNFLGRLWDNMVV